MPLPFLEYMLVLLTGTRSISQYDAGRSVEHSETPVVLFLSSPYIVCAEAAVALGTFGAGPEPEKRNHASK